MFLSLLPPFFIFPLSRHQYCLVWAVQLESPARVTVVRSLQIILAYAVQVVTISFTRWTNDHAWQLTLPNHLTTWSRWWCSTKCRWRLISLEPSPSSPPSSQSRLKSRSGHHNRSSEHFQYCHYHQYSHHIDQMMRRTFVDYWTLWYLQNLLKPKLSRRNPTRYIYSCSWV